MEICDETLETYRFLQREKRITIIETLDFAKQIANGLDILHGLNLIHRDLKPDNIFTTKKNGRIMLKIGDFGLTKFCSETDSTIGTITYMSPEQVQHIVNSENPKQVYSKSVDLWALGVIIHELVCGVKLFYGLHARAIAQNIVKFGDYLKRFTTSSTTIQPSELINRTSIISRVSNEQRDFLIYYAPWQYNVECLANLINDLLQFDPANRISASQVVSECEKIMSSPDLKRTQFQAYEKELSQLQLKQIKLKEEAQRFLAQTTFLDQNNVFKTEWNAIASSSSTAQGSTVKTTGSWAGQMLIDNQFFLKVWESIYHMTLAMKQNESMINEGTKQVHVEFKNPDVSNLILKYTFTQDSSNYRVLYRSYNNLAVDPDLKAYLKTHYDNQVSVFKALFLSQNISNQNAAEKRNQILAQDKMEEEGNDQLASDQQEINRTGDNIEGSNHFVHVQNVLLFKQQSGVIHLQAIKGDQSEFLNAEQKEDYYFIARFEKFENSLEKFIAKRKSEQSFNHQDPRVVFEKVSFILEIAIGLNWIHTQGSGNLVHGNLNCKNIYVDEKSSEKVSIKIAFNSPTEIGQPKPSEEALNYEISFKSPAALIERKQMTREDDVWSLGVISHNICTYSSLFSTKSSAKDIVSNFKLNYFKMWNDTQKEAQGLSSSGTSNKSLQILTRITDERLAKLIDGMISIYPAKRYKLDYIITKLREIKQYFSSP